jgi:hypothetical protein
MRQALASGFAVILLLFAFLPVFGQKAFEGSFLMSFQSAESDKEFPLLWNIKNDSTGEKMALQVKDEMVKKGVVKRVVFIPVDSTWTMLISFNKIKQGTRVHGAAMYRDTMKHRDFSVLSTRETKIIDGYHCKKIIVESEKFTADVWVTKEINFDLCKIYRITSHCGMMNDIVRKGDWFNNRKLKSMVLEVVSTEKKTGQSYSIKISQISPAIDPSQFDTENFKIADIPEGENCGVELKE